MSVDRQQHEPLDEEEIDALVAFSSAVIENLDLNDTLFESITEWSGFRMRAYQQAFLHLNIMADPDSFGFYED